MRVVVTRPQADAGRTAVALRKLGHEVLVTPLMRVERIEADLSGDWRGVIITSVNAPAMANDNLKTLPLFSVGDRSAEAARAVGFTNVMSASGDARDLVKFIAEQKPAAPLLYLAGEDRAADLVGDLARLGIEVGLRVVYRAVTTPFPPELIVALKVGAVDAVLHYSARSAQNYVAGAAAAGAAALSPRHLCLSEAVAAPLRAAGARVMVARRPDETSLFELLAALRG